MYDELRLIALGFPLEDAVSVCYTLRREGKLEEFIASCEQEYKDRCAQYVREQMD